MDSIVVSDEGEILADISLLYVCGKPTDYCAKRRSSGEPVVFMTIRFSFDFLKRAFPSIFGESIAEKIENCARDWSRQNKACALLRNTPAGNSAMDL